MVSRTSFELNPEVVQAGAGTGKTTWLINKVICFSTNFEKIYGHKPRLIVCTFTRKAAYELKERLILRSYKNKDFLEYINSPKLFISTLHGLFYSFLKSYGWKTEITPDFQLISDSEEMEKIITLAFPLLIDKHLPLLKKIPFYHLTDILKFYVREKIKHRDIGFYSKQDFNDMLKEYNLFKKNPTNSPLFKNLLKKKEAVESIHFLPFFKEFNSFAEEFFPLFFSYKKNSGSLTMDDLELIFKNLIDRNKEILQAISKDWDHWFIDEYQDTSRIQEQIIKKITQFKNVSCVGDPGQSIYFFRNADPEVFDRRLKEYGKEPTKLITNYRSHTPLIHFFNDFFSTKKGFLKFEATSSSVLDSTSLMTDETTDREFKTASVHFIPYSIENPKQSTFYKILKSIQRLTSMKNEYRDIAILSTRNEDLNALALFLIKKNIPVLSATTGGFFRKRILLDFLFLYKFLINPHDAENLIALCRTPYFRVSDKKLSLMAECLSRNPKESNVSTRMNEKNSIKSKEPFDRNLFEKELSFQNSSHEYKGSLWEHCIQNFNSDRVVKNLQKCLTLKKHLGILPAFEKLIFEIIFNKKNNVSDYSEIHESDIWKLLKQLYKRQISKQNPLNFYYSFLDENLSDEETLEAPLSTISNTVKLLTVHGSKGLEFKHIILFNLSKSMAVSKEEAVYDSEKNKIVFSVPFEGRNQTKIKCYAHKKILFKKNEKIREETDRQLYVAMTRAKNSLSLFVPEDKIPKHSWFERFSFFESFYNKKEDGSLIMKEGLYKRKGYSILVKRFTEENKEKKSEKIQDSLYIKPACSDIPSLENKKELPTKCLFKSSRDFINFITASKEIEDKQSTFSSPLKSVNIFFKSQTGGQLHYYLRLLHSHPLDKIQKKIETSFLSSKEKQDLIKALDYVMSLKQPSLSFFIKKGFVEWAFKLKEQHVTLQGQMDLWGWKDKHIYLFDYKSGIKNREMTKKQLTFYSYILDQIYKPESVTYYGIYPFQRKIEKHNYSFKQKQEISLWLKSIKSDYTCPV